MVIEVFKMDEPKTSNRTFVIRTDYEIDGRRVYIGSSYNGFVVYTSSYEKDDWKNGYRLVGIDELPEYVQNYINSEFFEIDLGRFDGRRSYYVVPEGL